jgi:hypothetical protein
VLRCLGLARPAGERLRRIVEAAAARAGVRPASAWEVRWGTRMNALAFVATRQVAVTEAALSALDDAEIESLCVHELAHLTEPRRVRMWRHLGVLIPLPLLASRPLGEAYGPASLLLGLGVIALMVLWRRAFRRWEVAADAAATATEDGARAYASALEKMYRLNLMPVVIGARTLSHPELFDRLVSAGVPMAGPRPQPPSSLRMLSVAMSSFLLAALTLLVLEVGRLIALEPVTTQTQALVSVALGGGGRGGLSDLGNLRLRRGDLGAARAFYLLAAEDQPDAAEPLALLARLFAVQGDCEAAQECIVKAEPLSAQCADGRVAGPLATARDAVAVCRQRQAPQSAPSSGPDLEPPD